MFSSIFFNIRSRSPSPRRQQHLIVSRVVVACSEIVWLLRQSLLRGALLAIQQPNVRVLVQLHLLCCWLIFNLLIHYLNIITNIIDCYLHTQCIATNPLAVPLSNSVKISRRARTPRVTNRIPTPWATPQEIASIQRSPRTMWSFKTHIYCVWTPIRWHHSESIWACSKLSHWLTKAKLKSIARCRDNTT